MRWLITGSEGMLGQDLTAALAAAGETDVTGTTLQTLDITDAAAVRAAVAGHDIVVNVAAWTDVDGAESREWAASEVNGVAVAHLARAAAAGGAHLVQVSTDYVFPGDGDTPYAEDAAPMPLNAYGRSKLLGERAVAELLPERGYVVRTAWLYGRHGRNFVTTMLRLARERDTVSVVTDEIGQPTWSRYLAAQLVALGRAAAAGTAPAGRYHGTAGGQASRYELARAVFEISGLDPDRVRPTTSEHFPLPAKRPGYSVLSHDGWSAAGLAPLADWRVMLTEALTQGAVGDGVVAPAAAGTRGKST